MFKNIQRPTIVCAYCGGVEGESSEDEEREVQMAF